MSTPASQTAARMPPWHAPLLIRASIGCHLGAGLLVAPEPALWPWALGAVAVNHSVLAFAGMSPRCNWMGENISRLPAVAAARNQVALTFDDGPDPDVTPALLDQLDEHGAHATFFCIAHRARQHSSLCRDIVRRGHSVQNHSDQHSFAFAFSGVGGFAREIGAAQATLADITGAAPRFFRAPAGMRNPLLGPALERCNLRLVSWSRRAYDTVQRTPQRVLERVRNGLAHGDIVLLHDGNVARTANGRPVVLEVVPQLLHYLAAHGLRSVTLPHAFAHAPPAPAAC